MENRLIRSAFASDRLDGVMLIAGQLAVSLDNALVYASLERKVAERTHQLALANRRLELLSTTDPVTGLANRRRLEEVLTAQWQKAARSGRPLALAMVDIDHFKAYNDHYGHAAGDRCLQAVAAELSRNVRDADLPARYGGEEFVVVMPDTDASTALQLAERVRAAIANLAEPHRLVPDRIVTVSIGVATTVPVPDDLVETLLERADAELYRAKLAGRNRVRVSPASPGIAGDLGASGG
jgi:diguanylate cyclase (GGDEF)-like protein